MVYAGTRFYLGDRDVWEAEQEHQRLSHTLHEVRDLLAIEFTETPGDQLSQALMRPASVFHYSGHIGSFGGQACLVREVSTSPLERSAAQTERHPQIRGFYGSHEVYMDPLDCEELASLLRRAGTRLAIFSACNSGRWLFVRPLLEAGLQVVVGVQGVVSVRGASAFCQKLYASLALGLSLDEAVTWARLHLLEPGVSPFQESLEWGAFMVYMPTREAVLFPRPEVGGVQQRQESARRQREQTIIYVNQTIYGNVTDGAVIGVRGSV